MKDMPASYPPIDISAEMGALPIDPLDRKKVEGAPELPTDETVKLSETQWEYQSYLEQRLTRAQEVRDRLWPEFSNKTYLQYYQQNEKIANTYLEAPKNEGEPKIATGTIEGKLTVLLSHIDNLNLTPEVRAFDKSNRILRDLGTAFTDILDVLAEHDGGLDTGDQEKRMLRQKELLKQGTVFIQDKWCTKKTQQKILTQKYNGEFNFDAWETAWKTSYEGPDRVLLYGPNVYLGDITQFSMDEQPYAFTIETMTYDSAKTIFGGFENWKYVKKGPIPASTTAQNAIGGRTIYDGKFRMTSLKDDQVEIVKYQDPIRDEFQIMINGIMMLPIGFPLSAVTPGGKINIAKQILYPINPQFAYGKSFVQSGDVYELSKQLDEMLKLFVLKTRKSITPAYLNSSGRIISPKVLLPGVISQGIPQGSLQPLSQNEVQGVTQGEYNIYKEILDRIEQSTVSPIFAGQFGKSNTTATEVLEVQRQARLALGIIISSCTLLEVKLAYLRLPLVISHYFAPIGAIMGEDGKSKNVYRSTSKEVDIPMAGRGMRRVVPIDMEQMPNTKEVRALELMEEKETGYPMQLIFISPKRLRRIEVTWRVTVSPKERDSSAYEKLLFREMISDAIALYKLGSVPNVRGLEDQLSKIYSVDRSALFGSAADSMTPKMDQTSMEMQLNGSGNASGASSAPAGMPEPSGAGV